MSTTTITYSSTKTSSFAPSSFSAPQRKTMSITQTYFLAHKARAKLSSQAARPDHNLRLLVGHANLLDTLMLELADAEREQESWFNQSVRGANKAQQSQQSAPKADRHVQWADTVIEEPEEEWHADNDDDSDASSDASSDYSESDDDEFDDDFEQQSPASSIDDEDILMADAAPLRRVNSNKAIIETVDEDEYSTEEEEDEEDDEATHAHLTLTRSPSHSASSLSSSPSSSLSHISSPPELVIEEDSDISSEDDESSMPPSPPAVALQSFDKKTAAATTTAIKALASPQEDDHDAFDDDSTAHYYLPPRNPARLITALSVY
ncbi:hypothetical protein Sste5346_000135 [Sporothrix stenoceras]|uniref:Protein ECM13 n=1 Tax=Sporothrix stenoceras TaxID=5173 RepID=A0ABR3ZVI4_9PEZI